jgi:hypothetical protein
VTAASKGGAAKVEKIADVEGFASVHGVVLGVDTHLDLHVAVALDQLGRRLGELTVPTTTRGYQRLLRWAEGFGPVGRAGIEGTSSYGTGLAPHLKAAGISVVEVERPKRPHHRRNGKSDPIDAEAAEPGRCWPARLSESPRRAGTDGWR